VRCNNNGICTATAEIEPPPGSTCENGGEVLDFTADQFLGHVQACDGGEGGCVDLCSCAPGTGTSTTASRSPIPTIMKPAGAAPDPRCTTAEGASPSIHPRRAVVGWSTDQNGNRARTTAFLADVRSVRGPGRALTLWSGARTSRPSPRAGGGVAQGGASRQHDPARTVRRPQRQALPEAFRGLVQRWPR